MAVWLWACHRATCRKHLKSIEIIQAADLVARLPVTRSCILTANQIRTELSTFENDDLENTQINSTSTIDGTRMYDEIPGTVRFGTPGTVGLLLTTP